MLNLAIKFGVGSITATVALGMFITLLGRQIRSNYDNGRSSGQYTLEYFFFLSLKGYTLAYLASILAAAVLPPVLLLASWPVVQSIPGELSYVATIGLTLASISGLIAMPAAFLKKAQTSRRYLPVVITSEPGIYSLVAELTLQFKMPMINDIRLTPGADIKVRERVDTFDQVFTGGEKVVEIGLASMEMLNAGDLRILLARELSHYAGGSSSSMAYINRLISRFGSLTDNLAESGFLMMLNPVTWMVFLAKPVTFLIAEDYLVMHEYKADNEVLKFSSTNRLTHALARYNVKTELYRDLLNIIGESEKSGIGYVGNVYDSMRRLKVESTSDLVVMIDHLFKDSALTRGDVGKRSLRLRLRRLPEASASFLEINRPAIAYLTDWRKTENRMIKILGI